MAFFPNSTGQRGRDVCHLTVNGRGLEMEMEMGMEMEMEMDTG